MLCQIPPKTNFLPAEGVQKAEWCTQPRFIRSGKGAKGARAAGLRYERRAQLYLAAMAGSREYLRGPWVAFKCHGDAQWRYCQPDGVLVEEKRIVIVEIKYHHTTDAWWQLWRLYRPVVQFLFKGREVLCVEVVKWADMVLPFPGATWAPDPFAPPAPPLTGVHLFNGREE